MKTALSLQEKLKDLRVERGLTLEELATETNISKSALGNYEKDDKDISHYSIIALAKFYDVSTDYLLGFMDNKNHPNAELHELHLNDEMIDLLKSGRINNRLLCELAMHKDFVKLLADIEIYVDGIASIQINNLNAIVDAARAKITEKYQPGTDDPHMRILNAARIQTDEYFQHVVHGDIDNIIVDIRATHAKDSEREPESNPMLEIKEVLDEAADFVGSPMEKQAIVFCRQLGIDYKKLSQDEFRQLIHILQKSKLIKPNLRQRGKNRKR